MGAHELAYAMRCFSPPDSEKMLRSASSSNPSWRMVSCVRSRMRSSGHAMLSSENATSPVESTLKNCVRGFWNTEPTHAATSQLSRSATSRPSTSTRPSSVPGKNEGANPFASLVTVVLPQPDAPHTSTHRPASTAQVDAAHPLGRARAFRRRAVREAHIVKLDHRLDLTSPRPTGCTQAPPRPRPRRRPPAARRTRGTRYACSTCAAPGSRCRAPPRPSTARRPRSTRSS